MNDRPYQTHRPVGQLHAKTQCFVIMLAMQLTQKQSSFQVHAIAASSACSPHTMPLPAAPWHVPHYNEHIIIRAHVTLQNASTLHKHTVWAMARFKCSGGSSNRMSTQALHDDLPQHHLQGETPPCLKAVKAHVQQTQHILTVYSDKPCLYCGLPAAWPAHTHFTHWQVGPSLGQDAEVAAG